MYPHNRQTPLDEARERISPIFNEKLLSSKRGVHLIREEKEKGLSQMKSLGNFFKEREC